MNDETHEGVLAVASPYLTAQEAAQYLRTTIQGIYSRVKRRKLKAMPGSPGRLLFTREALDACLPGTHPAVTHHLRPSGLARSDDRAMIGGRSGTICILGRNSMGWQRNYVTLTTGDRVRYSLIRRADSPVYLVRFKSPEGKWLERTTGAAKKSDAIDPAHRVILETYHQVVPSSDTVTWAVARQRLKAAMEADGKRPRTIGGYLETLDRLVAMFPLARGPADITDRMAGDFKTKYASEKFTRKRKKTEGMTEPPTLARKTKSLDSRVRTLKAVFGWLKRLGLVEGNPFAKVELPDLDRHEVKYVKQSDVIHFFGWLEDRYPGWAMPRLLFTVKALSGCRLDDLCNIRSAQLVDGRVVFGADTTKNRSERYVPLPADVFTALDGYKGETFLWERYPAELREATIRRGAPIHKLNPVFSPRRLYHWVIGLMQDYQRLTGRRLSSHDFRRAAFTRAAEKNIHPKMASTAFDVTPETMLRYYTATDKKRAADEVLGGLAADLMPVRPAGETTHEKEKLA